MKNNSTKMKNKYEDTGNGNRKCNEGIENSPKADAKQSRPHELEYGFYRSKNG